MIAALKQEKCVCKYVKNEFAKQELNNTSTNGRDNPSDRDSSVFNKAVPPPDMYAHDSSEKWSRQRWQTREGCRG